MRPYREVKWISERQTRSDLILLAICGITGPIFFTLVVMSLGLLQSGYNHTTQYLSELGAMGAPNAVIMNIAGFSLLGISIIAFALGLHFSISDGRGSKIGPALLSVSGAGLVGVGVFPCDPGCVMLSFAGTMHVVSARVASVGMILALFVIAQRFKDDRQWKSYRLYTYATSLMMLILGSISIFIKIEGWIGAYQRVFWGVRLLWIEITAIKLFKMARA